MSLSKRDIGLLCILLGIIAFLVCYLAVYNPTTDKNQTLQNEINNLKPERDRLRALETRKPEFEEQIAQSKETIASISEGFPPMVRQEDLIMYAVALENNIGIDTAGLSFKERVLLQQMESIIGADGEIEFEEMSAYKIGTTINLTLTYLHLKDIVDFVYNVSNKTTIDSVTVSYNAENGVLHGTLNIGKYYLSRPSDPYVETYVPPMIIGVPNPFRTLDEIPGPDDYDEDGNLTILDEEGRYIIFTHPQDPWAERIEASAATEDDGGEEG